MKKGCLVFLAQVAVFTGLYYLYFRGRFTPPADLWGAIAGGFFLSLSIGAFRNAALARRNAGLLDRAMAVTPPADGERIAAVGPIRALGTPLVSPFSHTSCVMYSYDISHERPATSSNRGEDRNVKDISGVSLTPCAIETPGGNIRLLGFPVLEGFPDAWQTGSNAFANAESYLLATSFDRVKLLGIFSIVKELLADEDGYIRKDWFLADDDNFRLNPAVHKLKEQVVTDGETVCAVGHYSAQAGGLVPAFDKGGEGLKLIQGGVEEARAKLKGEVKKNIGLGIFLLIVSQGILFLLLNIRESGLASGG
jgi:hypothetical protein